jgi:sulfatase maturation enzyme AslB (radical SAM superfamily)
LFNNLETLFSRNFKVSITCVISIYNVYYIDEFIQFLKDQNYLDKLYNIEILYAFGELLSPALLPDYAKQELLAKLKKDTESDLFKSTYLRFPSFKSSIAGLENYINDATKSYTFERFIATTETFDKRYNKNVADVFPWLGEVIDNYKNTNNR